MNAARLWLRYGKRDYHVHGNDAAEGEELDFGNMELWVAPALTAICAAVLAGAVILLMRRDRKPASA